MIEATVEKLISMKLHGMAGSVQEQIKNPAYKELSFEERLSMLVDREMDSRQDRKLRMLLTKARFRYPGACIENINFRAKRGITIARADGSYAKLLQKLSRINLLIVDDWGLSTLSDTERRDFLEIMEDRYNVRSTIVSSQIPVDKWHDLIGEPTIADAICDRLIHNSYKLKLTGKSMRGGDETTEQ